MEEIFNKLKVDFQFLTGYDYKGLVASIGAGFATRLSEFNSKLRFIEKQAFVATADKDYLYLHSGSMLPPNPPETAKGFVVFYGEENAIVLAGTEIKDSVGSFKTLSDATITKTILNGTVSILNGVATFVYPSNEITNCKGYVNGVSKDITVIDGDTLQFEAGVLQDGEAVQVTTRHTATVSVVSEDSGIKGNRNLNDVLKTTTTIENIDKEVGVILISGGKDEEAIEDYRKRVQDYLKNPQSPFNKNNIRYTLINSIKTLKYVWIKSDADGTVKVVALNKNMSLTQDEINEIVLKTKGIAPAQMDITAITSTAPTLNEVQVVIQDLSPTSDGLRDAVEKNIEYIYNVDMYEKGISTSQLEATIYKTTNGVEQVESFTLVSGETAPTADVFWKYTGTTFQ